jgi:hypothetical protein
MLASLFPRSRLRLIGGSDVLASEWPFDWRCPGANVSANCSNLSEGRLGSDLAQQCKVRAATLAAATGLK